MEKSIIMAIDDQNFNLQFLRHTLQEYTFIGVTSCQEAATLLASTLPDLILLDVIMPDMDGYEFIKILKAEERTRSIPVIFVTSLNSVKDEETGFNLGAVDYITKPFNPTIVRARIRNTLKFIHQQKLLEKMALIDGLTEIPNRRFFENALFKEYSSASRYKKHLSLIMIDVDCFKHYNDLYGHYKGDEVLFLIAQTINSCLKRPDDFLARYGGEEFAVILPNTDANGGKKIAEEIRQSIYNKKIPHPKSETDPYLTISLGGYSGIPKADDNAHSYIEEADRCLYQAKRNGKNLVYWA